MSAGTGWAGLAGMACWMLVARFYGLDGPYAALVNVIACALPAAAWSLAMERVHRRPSTGIDWTRRRPWAEVLPVTGTKLLGYAATWAGLAVIYAAARFYWEGNYRFAMWCLVNGAPVAAVLGVPYLLWLDRRLTEPHEGAYALGRLLLRRGDADRKAITGHLLAWGVKGFFVAFMLAALPGGFGEWVRFDSFGVLRDPVRLSRWLVTLMFAVDMAFATAGYLLTFRPLDTHIRSANPYAAAWMPALICYPPFILMGNGGPLDYHPGTAEWTVWLAGHPPLLWAFAAALVALTGVYAAATVAFGLRFSNLTNRGILTHGPYRWSRHPAYLSKNLFWWLSTLPFLSTAGLGEAARATLLLGAVSGVYYWRARTEERHLLADPDYVAYHGWAGRNAPVPRFFAWAGARRNPLKPRTVAAT